jgi:DNA-binding HxlR family transcriptional regulator
MATSYRQFCPVAKAMELLDERWTLLVVRELMLGSRHFNDLRRGVPRMSPTLLSKRLQTLVRAGVVDRRNVGQEVHYSLTPAGEELRPIVEALGAWGTRWMPELGDEDLDPKLLLWDMHRRVDRSAVPAHRSVVRFVFPDVAGPSRYWWLVIGVAADEVDVCDTDPGHEVTATVTVSLRALVDVWRGERTWADATRAGALTVEAPASVRRSLPSWFQLSHFAAVPRPRAQRQEGQDETSLVVNRAHASAPNTTT